MKHEQTTEKVQQGTGKTRVLAGRRWVIVRGTTLLAIAVAIFQGMKNTPQRIENSHTETVETRKEIGMKHYTAGVYTEAIKVFDEAIREIPPYDDEVHELYYWRGRAKFALKHYDAGIYDFREALDRKSDFARAYDWIAQAHMEMEEYSEAIAYFTIAIKISPDTDLYLKRGGARLKNGRSFGDEESRKMELESAVEDFTELVRRTSRLPRPYVLRGLCKYELGKPTAAIYDYNEAIQLKVDDPNAYYYRAKSYIEIGRRDDADQDYDKAIELAEKQGNTVLLESIYCDNGMYRVEQQGDTKLLETILKSPLW